MQACIKAQQDDAVKASVHEGEALGVEATPTMFVNGEKVDGALPIGELARHPGSGPGSGGRVRAGASRHRLAAEAAKPATTTK